MSVSSDSTLNPGGLFATKYPSFHPFIIQNNSNKICKLNIENSEDNDIVLRVMVTYQSTPSLFARVITYATAPIQFAKAVWTGRTIAFPNTCMAIGSVRREDPTFAIQEISIQNRVACCVDFGLEVKTIMKPAEREHKS